jgi:hypothetical protein
MKYIAQHKNEIELLSVEPLDNASVKKEELEKIGNKNSLLSQIPNLFASKQLSEAYKVVMPPGVCGELMQYRDGLLGTPLTKGGKIVGHAGLESMSGVVTPMLVFTAMSVATGQYFLYQINESLNDILDEIKRVKDLFLLKEESTLFSHSVFLYQIYQNYAYYNGSNQLRIATLGNIQRVISELTASIYFYAHNVVHVLDLIDKKGIKGELSADEIKQNLEKLKVAVKLRNLFIVMEFALSQSFDAITIQNVKNNIMNGNLEIFQPLIDKIFSTNEKMQNELISKANTKAKQKKLIRFRNELNSLKVGISKQHVEKSNTVIALAFDRLKQFDENGAEFYVIGDEVYTKSLAIHSTTFRKVAG